jgi:hypothetical protein
VFSTALRSRDAESIQYLLQYSLVLLARRGRAVARLRRWQLHLRHLFSAAAARIEIAAFAGLGAFDHFDLATTLRIGTAITFTFLERHDILLSLMRFCRIHV